MAKALSRIIIALAILGVLIWLFAPRFFANAANATITSGSNVANPISGVVQFLPAGSLAQSKTGDLKVALNGLQPNASYDVRLDQGECGNSSATLGTIHADNNGGADADFPLSSLDVNQSWFIDLYQQGDRVACSQLENNQTSSTQANNSIQAGPNVFGGTSSQTNNITLPNGSSSPTGLPNTGAIPGSSQHYDNNRYPRKY